MLAHDCRLGDSATHPIELHYSALAALLLLVGIGPLRRHALPAHRITAHSGTSNCRVQGHMPEVFDALGALVRAGKLRHCGVSVENVEEALKAIEFPGLQSVQIIYNLLRQRPAELLFEQTLKRGVGVLARLPLASGLLSGKFNAETQFAADDHRHFNRDGAAFDKGETFGGLDYAQGLRAVEALRALVPAGMSLPQLALRWIQQNPAVTASIPGGRRVSQVEENVAAADLPALSPALMAQLDAVYARDAKPWVHARW